jgi:hypothetical protein
MKAKFLLAFLPVVCLCGPAMMMHAQSASAAVADSPNATGSVAGVLKDPSGAVIAEARIEISNSAAHFKKTARSDRKGHFVVSAVPAGRCELLVTAAGFALAEVRDLAVKAASTAGLETGATIPSQFTDRLLVLAGKAIGWQWSRGPMFQVKQLASPIITAFS